MKLEYRHGETESSVVLRERGDGTVEAIVTATGGAPVVLELSATRLGDGRWIVKQGLEVHDVLVQSSGADSLLVKLGSGEVALERLDPFRSRGVAGKAAGGPRKVVSPIPGRVVEVLVAVGDAVTQGQPLVVLEAMKMANELRSPIAGRVTKLTAVKGEPVEGGVTLVVVEA